ncbi:PspC domain-containing protein [Saccharomonospora sp. NPDC006951]
MSGATNASKHIDGFEETVKDFWASRPRRPHSGRKLAGVAAGIGYRYGIDPVVIRVALVALTIFGGIGIAVYLLGWLFLPGEDDEVSGFENLIGKGRSSVSKGFALVLCLLLLPLSGWAFAGNWFDGGGILGAALLVTALYLLHRSRGHLNRPKPVTPVSRAPQGAATDHSGFSASYPAGAQAAASASQGGEQATSSWDPLAASPLAWDLPEPPPPPEPPAPPQPPRRKSKIGFAAFGVALAVAGVGTALAISGEPWFTPAHVAGLVLGVLGIGMVLGSFLGAGRGLIWLAVPLSAAGLALSAVPMQDFRGGFGNIHERPLTEAEVRPVYERTAGDIRLDLTGLPADAVIETSVNNGAGNTVVVVPRDADVTYSCENKVGDTTCLGREQAGVGLAPLTGTDTGGDGAGGQQINLTVKAAAGSLEVTRG